MGFNKQINFFLNSAGIHLYSHLNMLYLKCTILGATWLRRGLQNQRCMPRMRTLVNKAQININANDENFVGANLDEAIAA